MVGKVIRDYMEGGAKKLTVPGFGTFMRRDSGEVIFVDLLRGDDRVLGEMVEDAGNYSEVEAKALIDRFIFETKNAISRYGSSTIEGFGTMTIDHKGLYQFRYSPKARPVKETAVQESLFEKEETPVRQPVKTGAGVSAAASRPAQSPDPRQAVRHSGQKSAVSTRPQHHPRPAQRQPQGRPLQNRKPGKTKLSSIDIILIAAIAAALIALGAMIFGMSAGNMPFLSN